MFVYSFSHKGLYIYLIVPAYGFYKISGYLYSFCCSKKQTYGEEEADKKSNRQIKKEKAEREGKTLTKTKKIH